MELLNIRFTFSLRSNHKKSRWQISYYFTCFVSGRKTGHRNAGKVARSDKSAKTLNQNLAMIWSVQAKFYLRYSPLQFKFIQCRVANKTGQICRIRTYELTKQVVFGKGICFVE